MTSTFMGLEIAKRGMVAQQTALYVTGQNVSNASTQGYTRQVVNFQATDAYPSPGMNAPAIAGQLGTGVATGSIQRVRDNFLDVQYRTENNQLGYWQARSDSLSQMESIMNEPSDSGLASAMDQFWQSLQDLSASPTDSGALAVVRQRGSALADTFNYLSNSLSSIKNDEVNQINTTQDQINTDLQQLNTLNQNIGTIEAGGNLPNDLYDQRDKLLDDLSSMINIKVDYTKPTSPTADPNAQGMATVSLVDGNGTKLGTLLDGSNYYALNVNYDSTTQAIGSISISGSSQSIDPTGSSGKLKALVESYGYDDNGTPPTATGTYPDMLNQLDHLAYTFASAFNAQQQAGQSSNVINGTQTSVPPFFSDTNNGAISAASIAGLAGRIQISQGIQDSFNNIATAGQSGTLGDATNVNALANVIKENLSYGGSNSQATDFQSYYQNVVGGLGVSSQEATNLTTNSTTLQQSADQKRQSVSSVSLDEEMTNMIQYQHAYSASAKMISMENDILDTIINGMGVGN